MTGGWLSEGVGRELCGEDGARSCLEHGGMTAPQTSPGDHIWVRGGQAIR